MTSTLVIWLLVAALCLLSGLVGYYIGRERSRETY